MLKHKICIFERNKVIFNSIRIEEALVEAKKDLCTSRVCKRSISNVVAIVDMESYNTMAVTKFLISKPELYVIVVNAKENMKYQLYECGAADVMTGMLDKLELRYKIASKIKFFSSNNSEYYLGDIVYDIETRALVKDKKNVILPSMQNKIFTLLIRDYFEDKYLQNEEIFDSVIDDSSRIQNHIARLRYSLSYIGSDKVSIETIYGRGYKLSISE